MERAREKIKLFEINFLDLGSEDFLSKKPDSKCFKFCGSHVLCHNYLSLPLQRKSSQRQYINEHTQRSFSETLRFEVHMIFKS